LLSVTVVTRAAIKGANVRAVADRRLVRGAAVGVAAGVLFLVYWRLSWSASANSDSAAIALQAHDMLAGNWLLGGWRLADVSFYTTEVPQYVLLEAVLGLGAPVVHVAAAMTNVLIVVLVALLAAGPAGRAPGRVRAARAVLAAAIACSPQASTALITLLGPDHTGTVIPVLAVWLLIDRAPRRWWVPVVAGAAMAVVMVADQVVLLTVVGPLVLTALVRFPFRRDRYELWLALAAGLAACLGLMLTRLIGWAGGFQVFPVSTRTMPLSALPRDSWNTVQAVLELFGANVVERQPPLAAALTWLHLAGVLLALAGVAVAVTRMTRSRSIVVPGIAVAIGAELAAFLASVHSSNLAGIREIVAVMPLGAVLAGRTLAGPLLRWAGTLRGAGAPSQAGTAGTSRLRVAAVAVALVLGAGYAGTLVWDATRPSVPSANQALAGWLEARHLTSGLAAYWQAGSVTLDTGGRVHVASVGIDGRGAVTASNWETRAADYNPARNDATFLIAGGPLADVPLPGLAAAAIRTFGRPAKIERYGEYLILSWRGNLLAKL
jgi:hypothetical protein